MAAGVSNIKFGDFTSCSDINHCDSLGATHSISEVWHCNSLGTTTKIWEKTVAYTWMAFTNGTSPGAVYKPTTNVTVNSYAMVLDAQIRSYNNINIIWLESGTAPSLSGTPVYTLVGDPSGATAFNGIGYKHYVTLASPITLTANSTYYFTITHAYETTIGYLCGKCNTKNLTSSQVIGTPYTVGVARGWGDGHITTNATNIYLEVNGTEVSA